MDIFGRPRLICDTDSTPEIVDVEVITPAVWAARHAPRQPRHRRRLHSFDGFAGFDGISAAETTERLARADAGDITEGGAATAIEAARFIKGYVTKRYIPGRKLAGDMTEARAAKAVALASVILNKAALNDIASIGAGDSVLAQIRSAIAAPFLSSRADTDRAAALQVLQYATALFVAAGEPRMARITALQAGATREQAAATYGSIMAHLGQLLTVAVTTQPSVVVAAGALNIMASTAEGARDFVATASTQASAALSQLAQSAPNVAQAVTALQTAAIAVVTAPSEAAHAVLASAVQAVRNEVAVVEATASATIAPLAEAAQARIAELETAVRTAQSTAADLAAQVRTAVSNGATVSQSLIDRTNSLLNNPCLALPGAAQWVCQHPGYAIGGGLAIAAGLALILVLVALRLTR